MGETEFFYRYVEIRYSSGLDQFDNPLPGYELKLVLNTYKVLRHTPKGVWISMYGGISYSTEQKFILLSARKRFACPTVEEALVSFKARKQRQIKILKGQLKQAEEALLLVKNIEHK